MRVGIAGAGIMGRLLAFALAEKNHEVTLFDPKKENCSAAAAGLLTPFSELEKADAVIHQLGCAALLCHWPAILAKLNQPIYFKTLGTITVAHPNDKAELIRFIRAINVKLQTDAYYKTLDHPGLSELESELTAYHQAYYFPYEGQIDSQAVLQALENYLTTRSVKWDVRPVSAVYPYQIQLADEMHHFDFVFDCRGLGAKSIFHDLKAIRGELIWLQAEHVTIKRPIRFLHPRYALYLVPRPNKIYLLGASEIHAENYSGISVRTALELLTAAYCLHPGLAEASIVKTVTQCRPAFSHYLPRIYHAEGLIAVNGLYRHGFLIAPALMAEIMRSLSKQTLHHPELWETFDGTNSNKQ